MTFVEHSKLEMSVSLGTESWSMLLDLTILRPKLARLIPRLSKCLDLRELWVVAQHMLHRRVVTPGKGSREGSGI